MSFLTLAEIAKADDIPTEEVNVPEWGGVVKVRGMDAGERLQLGVIATNSDKGEALKGISRFALLHGMVEPEVAEEDIDMMLSKSAAAVDKIVGAFNRLSGNTEEDVLEARGNS